MFDAFGANAADELAALAETVLNETGQMDFLRRNAHRLIPDCAVRIHLQYTDGRDPKKQAGFHWDGAGLALFTNLLYFNDVEILRPEVVRNPKVLELYWEELGCHLPDWIVHELQAAAHTLKHGEIEGGFAPPNAIVSFVNPLCVHSTPLYTSRALTVKAMRKAPEKFSLDPWAEKAIDTAIRHARACKKEKLYKTELVAAGISPEDADVLLRELVANRLDTVQRGKKLIPLTADEGPPLKREVSGLIDSGLISAKNAKPRRILTMLVTVLDRQKMD